MAKDKDETEPKKNALLDDDTEQTDTNEEQETDTGDTGKIDPPAKPSRTPAPEKSDKEEVPAQRPNIQKGLESDAMATKRILDKRPKVQFMVPLGINEKPGAFEECYINGYRYTVKKGVMVSIPDRVAQLLANKYQVEFEAGEAFRIDRDKGVQDALS